MKSPFALILELFLYPLQGKEIKTYTGEINQIIAVDNNSITRRSSEGNTSKIPIDYMNKVFAELTREKRITRTRINEIYSNCAGDSKRGSSFIFAILSTLPFVNVDNEKNAVLLLDKDLYQLFWKENKDK